MRHFTKLPMKFDVSEVKAQLEAAPKLWNAHTMRKTFPGTSHSRMSDVWVRYNDIARLDPDNLAAFGSEHVPVWYPAIRQLPALRPIIFGLMAALHGEMLGGVLITRVPPGMGIAPHIDHGWHVDYYTKIYVGLQNAPGGEFCCEDRGTVERLCWADGDVYQFDNRKLHWVENNSTVDRLTLIVCIREFGSE